MTQWALDTVIQEPPGLVVHVGAGESGPGALADAARSAILIEPDPERAGRLRARYASATISVVEAAAGSEPGQAQLHRFSHAGMNSTREPTGARELFRGLSDAGLIPVERINPVSLVDEALLDGEGCNILIIDAASEVMAVIGAFEAAGLLERFDHILAKVSEIALHLGGADRAAVAGWAHAQGRMMLALPGQSDPDLWRAWIGPARGADRTADLARIQALEAEIADMRASAEAAQKHSLQVREQMGAELQSAHSRITELERQLADACAAREAAEHRLGLASDQLTHLKSRAEQDRNSAVQALEARMDEERRLIDGQRQAAQARALELERALELAAGRIETLEARMRALETQEQAQAEREQALKADLKASRENLRLALTGQRLAQASLNELQDRHAKLMDDRNALDALLRQVTDRLSSAAGYARQDRLTGARGPQSQDWPG
ncbi:hypothetical protein F1654_06985 [Alkalicaulis satelles]|uniref:FkbM family methyltransferase n=1 Tax=Alkalicaulis satelles TaxID=2609175 RepID=A0A5M6ZIA3_9PROT|nr:hypothetical protein [Alkalicaulis satelles]KAA5803544.1 hypothetical protein F1654_06985 [Alkalicaulis satelles]